MTSSVFHSPSVSIRSFGRGATEFLTGYLSRDPVENLFMLSWLENFGAAPIAQSDLYQFLGVEVDGTLDAVGLLVSRRLMLLDSNTPESSQALGRWAVESGLRLEHVVSVRRCVTPFWTGYRTGGAVARLDRIQRLYVLERGAWFSGSRERVSSETCGLSLAHLHDVDAVFLASARMHAEETLEDPLERDARHFRRHVEHRIATERTWVWFNDRRRLLFKADISAHSRFGAQISGVYTPPALRGQGIATRAVQELCQALFDQGFPRVTLYVNEDNSTAIRVYEKVGFERYTPYETIFVAR